MRGSSAGVVGLYTAFFGLGGRVADNQLLAGRSPHRPVAGSSRDFRVWNAVDNWL